MFFVIYRGLFYKKILCLYIVKFIDILNALVTYKKITKLYQYKWWDIILFTLVYCYLNNYNIIFIIVEIYSIYFIKLPGLIKSLL